MEPSDLTDQQDVRREFHHMNAQFTTRFEVIEPTLRDLARQLVVLGRAIERRLGGGH